MASDGTNARGIAESLEPRDSPTWSQDGKWIAVVASEGNSVSLFKVPVQGGAPVRLIEKPQGVLSNPVWSPDGGFIVYSEGKASGTVQVRAVTPEKVAHPLPELSVANWGERYRFLPDGKALVVQQGALWRQNFWLLDLATGRRRQLTDLGPEFRMQSFDVSPDGKQILFDRFRENSDVVLIDLPER
jgi:Tol biopolymer transport system component